MPDCKNCSGSCGNCSGCSGQLLLGPDEVTVLEQFAQTPFLPVARKRDDMTPIYREDDRFSQETYSILLMLLERKGLISIDYDAPLKGADMGAYAGYPVLGSMALTARGQEVLDCLDRQGAQL